MSARQTDPVPAREQFIPIRKAELVDRLAELLPAQAARQFRQLAQLLDATFHYEYHQRLESLKDCYAPFDPDADTVRLSSGPTDCSSCDSDPNWNAPREAAASRFFEQTVQLLERANFRRLDRAEIEHALEAASDWGINLEVNFGVFERLEVYARGDVLGQRGRQRLWGLRKEQVEVPIYQRLVVVFQLRDGSQVGPSSGTDSTAVSGPTSQTGSADSQQIYLKLFKNIPKMDLDMLLPGTRVKITRLDQGKIILPTLSGVAIALFKMIKGVALLATATFSGMISFLGLVAGAIGYGVKSFLGYLRTKDKYHLNLTRNLYYQNLDNNSGVLFRMLNEAEEQELREALLAYYLLWNEGPQAGLTESELDALAESRLKDWCACEIDFEIDDALAKLRRLGLIHRQGDGRLQAVAIDDALRRLDQAWDAYFEYSSQHDDRHPRAA